MKFCVGKLVLLKDVSSSVLQGSGAPKHIAGGIDLHHHKTHFEELLVAQHFPSNPILLRICSTEILSTPQLQKLFALPYDSV